MIRRLGTGALGLALALSIGADTTVDAHTNGGLSAGVTDVWTDTSGDTHVVGVVNSHASQRRAITQITATWAGASETSTSLVINLAQHSSAPFEIVEDDTDVSGAGEPDVLVSFLTTDARPVGALRIGSVDLAGDVATVSITNDSTTDGVGIQVFARRAGGTTDDVSASPLAPLASGATADFAVTFDDESEGALVKNVIATTTSGPFLTSWNNYFSDLGLSLFADEIAFMGNEGITTGCGNANFCPRSGVTRAEMAVFLTRALGLTDFSDFGFEDISSYSQTFEGAMNAVANAGIASGCMTDPMSFCPSSLVTRGQMSKFIVLGYGLAPIPGPGFFTDDDGHFSEPYNNRMRADEITLRCAPNMYCPHANVLREQMAAFIFRAENP